MAQARAISLRPLTRAELRSLLGARGAPALSVYLPTARAFPEAPQNPVRYRQAVQDAALRLEAAGLPREELAAWREMLERFASEADVFAHPLDGLAVFVSREEARAYRLPFSVAERIVAGERFEIRPLIRALHRDRRYRVLAVSVNRVALYEGDALGLEPAPLDGIPASLTDALGSEIRGGGELQYHSTRGAGAAPMYHSHHDSKDEREVDFDRFHLALAAGLERRLQGDDAPLVLAADETHIHGLRAKGRIQTLLPRWVPGNPDHLSASDLHERAWPLVQEAVAARDAEEAAGYERARNLGKAVKILGDVVFSAVAGRIHRLWLEAGRRIPGRVDVETGRWSEEAEADHDVLDDLAEIVLLRGGEVRIVERERMPTDTEVAAELR
ncbi:MAG TPA: hypothetical protein VML54_04005 [Candidatus Limnocylindrales bacterium]|nr:hypothetical protein [Candidatus Limnocylindrales bacterium]